MTSQRKKFDMAGAEAFAQLSPIQSASYHYTNDGFTDIPKAVLREYFTNELINQGAKAKYIDKVLATALAELSYPIPTNGDKHTWSGCQRAAYAGISQSTWSDNKLCKSVNFIIDTVRSNADTASREIQLQMMTHQ